MKNILEYKKALAITSGVLFTISGACVGYLVGTDEAERRFNEEFEATLKHEIERTRRYYATRYKDFGPEEISELDAKDVVLAQQKIEIPRAALDTPEGRAAVAEALEKMGNPGPATTDETPVEVEVTPVEVNAFEQSYEPPYFDETELRENRSADRPYVISYEEFYSNDANYETADLMFYETDGQLLDDDDILIPDPDQIVGDENLHMFGVMSQDNNVVFVQNDRSEMLFRVQRAFSSASEAIFGPDASEEAIIEHSIMKPRRPRRDEH